jgi:NADP-dependent aldehyde dehydrogenase
MSHQFRAINPATGEPIEPAFEVTPESGVVASVEAASSAVAALADPEVRALFLDTIASELETAADEIVDRAGLETALPEARLRAELGRTTGQLRLFARVAREGSWVDARIDSADPERQPLPRPDVRSMLVPLGPVAVFGASNFPLAFSVAGGDSASAWAAGNPVIVKAHPAHPGTSKLVGDAIQRAARSVGLPDGVFGIVYDDAHEVGMQLVADPRLKAVGFTGSQAGGTALAKLAAARAEPIPVFAEMGSINPVVVLPGALEDSGEEIATGLFGSCTLGVGQFCTSPGLVFVPAGDAGDALVARIGDLVGTADLPPMLTAGIAKAYGEGSARLIEDGARLVAEGREGTPARVFEVGVDALGDSLVEELFGPSTLIARYAHVEDLLTALHSLEGQLTATLYASDRDETSEVWRALSDRAGRVLFGGFPTGVEVCGAMVHGGPWPATSDGATTSVGTRAIRRFARLLAFQNAPQELLPPELRDGNPRRIWRLVDGEMAK